MLSVLYSVSKQAQSLFLEKYFKKNIFLNTSLALLKILFLKLSAIVHSLCGFFFLNLNWYKVILHVNRTFIFVRVPVFPLHIVVVQSFLTML